MENKLLTDADMANLLGISTAELRKKICRGESVPPNCKIPGMRRRLWFADSFEDWLRSFESTPAVPQQSEGIDSLEQWRKYKH